MRAPRGVECHECAPEEWRRVPNVTGSYELDAVIRANPNKDMANRLRMYCSGGRVNAYGGLTGYDGYSGYSGDN